MSDSQQPTTSTQQPDLSDGFFFSYRGRIGRAKYWIGLAIAFGCLVLALAGLVKAMSTTGGGSPFLDFPLLGLFFWIHSLVTIKRLRDAGMPAWHYVIYGIGPFVWLALTIRLIESIGVLIAIGLLAFYVLPGLYSSKTDETPPDTTPAAP